MARLRSVGAGTEAVCATGFCRANGKSCCASVSAEAIRFSGSFTKQAAKRSLSGVGIDEFKWETGRGVEERILLQTALIESPANGEMPVIIS